MNVSAQEMQSIAKVAAEKVRKSVCPYAGELAATIREIHAALGTSDARTRRHKMISHVVVEAAKNALSSLA